MQVHDVMVDEPGVSILVRRMSCYDVCCWDNTKLEPVMRNVDCSNGVQGNWAHNVLFNPEIYRKLAAKKVEFEKKKAQLIKKAGEEVSILFYFNNI